MEQYFEDHESLWEESFQSNEALTHELRKQFIVIGSGLGPNVFRGIFKSYYTNKTRFLTASYKNYLCKRNLK